MKPVSIRIQIILALIPFFNMFNILVWWYNCWVVTGKKMHFAGEMMGIGGACVIIISYAILSSIFPGADYWLRYLNGYLFPMVMGFGYIKYQYDNGMVD